MWPWRRRSDEDFAEEIQAHIANEMKRLVEEDGLSFNDAKAQALRSFGNVTHAQERFYDGKTFTWVADLHRDVTYALRSLRRTPAFAAATILTLAIGIGATTAIYSVVNAILLQPLPFQNADRMVRLVENYMGLIGSGSPARVFQRGVSYKDFVEWRSRTQTLSDVFAFSEMPMLVRSDSGITQLRGGSTSANTFSLLGVEAALGRTLVAADERSPDVIVLGFDTWRRVFHSDAGIIGKKLQTPGNQTRLRTIVGVLPEGFEFPVRSLYLTAQPVQSLDFYVPIDPSRRYSNLIVIGFRHPGATLQAAREEANVLGAAIRPPPDANRAPLTVPRFDVQEVKAELVKELQPALHVLLAAVAVVLMIVCANVANLLLARGSARQREIAVRFAIGASRGRVLRQALTESLVLASAGGALGALLGAGGVSLVRQLTTIDVPGIFQLMFGTTILPRGYEVNANLNVFASAFAVAGLASVFFGLLPALHLSRTSHVPAMASRSASTRHGDTGLRSALVVGQVLMATVLLVSAGLLVKSFVNLTTVNKGYDASQVLALQLLFPGDYPITRKLDTIDRLLTRLRAHSDVQSAGFSRAGVLISEEIMIGTWIPPGRSAAEMRTSVPQLRVRSVSDGFLPAMGIQLLAGRDLDSAGHSMAQPSIVINRSAEIALFGKGRGVGQIITWDLEDAQIPVQVIGVAEDLRNESLEHEPVPEVFIDYRHLLSVSQRMGDTLPWQNQTALGVLSFAIRTRSAPETVIPEVVHMVRSVDANAGIDALVPVSRLVSSSLARQRFYAVMLAAFAGVSTTLACIGVYGVLAYAVTRRTQEIGIRMALGAHRREVLMLVLRKGVMLTAAGIFIGLGAAAAGTRLLEGMLFGITSHDTTTFVVVALLFGGVATCASYLPARRATAVNPIVALRTE